MFLDTASNMRNFDRKFKPQGNLPVVEAVSNPCGALFDVHQDDTNDNSDTANNQDRRLSPPRLR